MATKCTIYGCPNECQHGCICNSCQAADAHAELCEQQGVMDAEYDATRNTELYGWPKP